MSEILFDIPTNDHLAVNNLHLSKSPIDMNAHAFVNGGFSDNKAFFDYDLSGDGKADVRIIQYFGKGELQFQAQDLNSSDNFNFSDLGSYNINKIFFENGNNPTVKTTFDRANEVLNHIISEDNVKDLGDVVSSSGAKFHLIDLAKSDLTLAEEQNYFDNAASHIGDKINNIHLKLGVLDYDSIFNATVKEKNVTGNDNYIFIVDDQNDLNYIKTHYPNNSAIQRAVNNFNIDELGVTYDGSAITIDNPVLKNEYNNNVVTFVNAKEQDGFSILGNSLNTKQAFDIILQTEACQASLFVEPDKKAIADINELARIHPDINKNDLFHLYNFPYSLPQEITANTISKADYLKSIGVLDNSIYNKLSEEDKNMFRETSRLEKVDYDYPLDSFSK